MDKVEQQEREDEAANTSSTTKPTKKLKLTAAAPKKKKALGVLSIETMPSPKGRRVEPKIDDEMKKKAEKAVLAKEKKGSRQVFAVLLYALLRISKYI